MSEADLYWAVASRIDCIDMRGPFAAMLWEAQHEEFEDGIHVQWIFYSQEGRHVYQWHASFREIEGQGPDTLVETNFRDCMRWLTDEFIAIY